ncbi:inositol 1,4,5-triphosphate receptor associated 2-like [Ambystoma mexicanum]|uniref:inositol 1,4,5-triphosphate receptor associated 2-like n=1 Tax=Ambystoma mexicanum TaxID=8296 RepID=UPI0037E986F0
MPKKQPVKRKGHLFLTLMWVSLTEQDVEAAFAHLSLAFRCDSFTLRRRVQVEERARDVAEENIQQELDECRTVLQRLTLSCMEERWQEMATQLQESLMALTGSIERVTKAAEVLGAVHQEARMSRAAEVMIQHVENLKRRHSREHAELEDMKRLIQQNSRNRQLAEIRDDGELKSKPHLMRALQQVNEGVVPLLPTRAIFFRRGSDFSWNSRGSSSWLQYFSMGINNSTAAVLIIVP